VNAEYLAWVYEGLGGYKRANDWMNRAIAERDDSLANLRGDLDMWNDSGNPYASQWLKKIGFDKQRGN
jgi:hypothetical protein